MRYGEALLLVWELRSEPGTRTWSSEHDWAWSATWPEIAAIEHAEWFMNVNRKPESAPVVLERPWSKPAAKVEQVSPEELAELTALLNASTVVQGGI